VPQLYNLNIPTVAMLRRSELRIVPMGVARYGEHFLKRQDPKGRTYYWATNDPPPPKGNGDNDLTALEQGYVTLTPLQYDMTRQSVLSGMRSWSLELPDPNNEIPG
jgi:5'-nucleotidase